MERLNKPGMAAAFLNASFGSTFAYRSATTLSAVHGTIVLIGLDTDVVVGGVRGRVLIVPPDTLHSACCPGPTVGYMFDPERCPRIAGFAKAGGTRALDVRYAGAVLANRGALTRPDVLAGVGSELERLLATGEPQRLDRRIARLLDELRNPTADRLAAVARTRLSPAHVQALFARDVGVPMRTYGLWRRLRYALRHAFGNVGLLDFTAAAHAAGFADLAHFSRTHRRMLGYAPSEVRKNLVLG
jgi:AraC-like DNA-binding protein